MLLATSYAKQASPISVVLCFHEFESVNKAVPVFVAVAISVLEPERGEVSS